MLENAIASGVLSMGVDVFADRSIADARRAYITRSLRADAGIVLTASHNSYEDNGIKFFATMATSSTMRSRNRSSIWSSAARSRDIRPTAEEIGKAMRIDDALGRYVEFAKRRFPKA